MVASYGQLTRKGESQRVNPMASLLRIMSQHRILPTSHMEPLKTAWGLNNLDKNVNTCLFRQCFICSVSSVRYRQSLGRFLWCVQFSKFCTNTRVAAPAVAAPSVWRWLAQKRERELSSCDPLQIPVILLAVNKGLWTFRLGCFYDCSKSPLVKALDIFSCILNTIFHF